LEQPEAIWIRTTRVHDWCYKRSSTTLTLTDLAFPEDTATVAGVECDVVELTCAEIARSRPAGGVVVVTLRKQATLDFVFVNAGGDPVPVAVGGEATEVQRRTRFWDEFVQLAAPEEAEIHCELSDVGCRTALTVAGGANAVAVELFDIQSIAVEAAVRLRVNAPDPVRPGVALAHSEPFAPMTE
jgi:hypothetical protein